MKTMSKARAAYYLLLIALLMPSLPENRADLQIQASAPDTTQVSAGSFCGDRSNLCQAAGYLLRKIEAKARYSIYVLQHWPEHSEPEDIRQRA
jgi:hypothetical protein